MCAFHDAYYTPENAVIYFAAFDLGTLRDLKEKMDANDEELSGIHVLGLHRAVHASSVLSAFWLQVICTSRPDFPLDTDA
jgi:hypothetical protein